MGRRTCGFVIEAGEKGVVVGTGGRGSVRVTVVVVVARRKSPTVTSVVGTVSSRTVRVCRNGRVSVSVGTACARRRRLVAVVVNPCGDSRSTNVDVRTVEFAGYAADATVAVSVAGVALVRRVAAGYSGVAGAAVTAVVSVCCVATARLNRRFPSDFYWFGWLWIWSSVPLCDSF